MRMLVVALAATPLGAAFKATVGAAAHAQQEAAGAGC
jgi:hypothetical protein